MRSPYVLRSAQSEHDRSAMPFGIETGHRVENQRGPDGYLRQTTRFSIEGYPTSIQRYDYTAHGDMSENATLNTDFSIRTLVTNRYEYDHHNNWISKKTLKSNNVNEAYDTPSEDRERDITYY